ncbi:MULTISPECIES: imidazole glycerol phosphate synthase subunit HisH [Methylotenera]|uniref:imidazole glycerol phosphate synthase subunit HisH n=1 Tax=Methylotenera TaxID=359407 RepID=UPI0003621DAD|nr:MULTISPECIES: imidazole glycerol phosphate synthase subunit HisH [Methylotenera]
MTKIDIAVVDYGMGNLRSVSKAVEHVAQGKSVVITSDASVIQLAERIVFPGQGAMPDCMRELDSRNLRDAILYAAANKPFLGICIGMQLLFEHSEEGDTAGLGIFKGDVKRFAAHQIVNDEKLKIPHMGWNQVYQLKNDQDKPHALWQDIEDATRFYHVHSYYAAPLDAALTVGETEYPERFCSVVAQDNIFATQFHVEKSAQAGLQLLRNFVYWKP